METSWRQVDPWKSSGGPASPGVHVLSLAWSKERRTNILIQRTDGNIHQDLKIYVSMSLKIK